MAIIGVDISVEGAIGFMNSLSNQVPFALSRTLNNLKGEAEEDVRQTIQQRFTLRTINSARYLLRSIAPLRQDYSSKTKLQAVVRLRSPIPSHPNARILGGFVEGEPKVSFDPTKPVIVPTRALRPSKASVIQRSLYPINLGLTARTDPAGRKYFALGRGAIAKGLTPFHGKSIQGRKKTFVLSPDTSPGLAPKAWGVYRRTAPGQGYNGSDIEMIWSYRRRVSRPKLLPIGEITKRRVDARFVPEMQAQFAAAVRTAR